MSYNKWPKRSAEKNYFMVPNEIFSIGLDYREISLYTYLLRCENRKTYQCYPSYKTIGKAIGMSENTVAKYVRQLEEKGLIYTEPTMVRSKDGRPLNGNLLYTIRPIPGVLEAFYERQFRQAEEAAARYRAAQLLEKSNAQGRQNALCAPFREEASPPVPARGLKPDVSRFLRTFAGQKKKQDKRKSRTKEKAGQRHGVASAAAASTSARSAGSFGRLKLASLRGEKSGNGVSFPEKPRAAGLFKDVLQQKGGIE